VDADALDVHLLTVVGHKMYAPKGVAALWGPGGIALRPVIGVGGQEADPRAGTENVPPSSHSATQSISPDKPWPTGRPSGSPSSASTSTASWRGFCRAGSTSTDTPPDGFRTPFT